MMDPSSVIIPVDEKDNEGEHLPEQVIYDKVCGPETLSRMVS
jgi:hypothetical protein